MLQWRYNFSIYTILCHYFSPTKKQRVFAHIKKAGAVGRKPTPINQPDVPVIRVIPCSLQITSPLPPNLVPLSLHFICWIFTLCHPVSGFSSGFSFIWIWDLAGLGHGGLTPGCCVCVLLQNRVSQTIFQESCFNCSSTEQILTVAWHLFMSFFSPWLSQISLDACA